MNHPREFLATVDDIANQPEKAEEVLAYYTPTELHMLILKFLFVTFRTQHSSKEYNHITLIGEFMVWAKDHEVQNG